MAVGASAVDAQADARTPIPALDAIRDGWTETPALADLFAPPSLRSEYRAFVSPLALDEALRRLADDPSLMHPPGAWQVRSLAPTDAFGLSGPYNRWTVARLYGSTSVRVARGPRGENGRVTESWTLVSPYPDRTLRHLERGTLLLVARVPPL
jgi:hypothetical protein